MYREELDGIRALAIVAVLINHTFKTLLPGGYLGVDLFFVISGYVVANSWRNRKEKSAAKHFYQRRLKRLQPALTSMVIITFFVITGCGLLTKSITITALMSLIGAGNISLLHQSLDYFGQAAEKNPFTHTWSLGVEEQFYLVFPFIAKKERLLPILSLFSFTIWIYLQLNKPESAFYLMPARFWEISVGILILVLCSKHAAQIKYQWISLIALLISFNIPQDFQLWATPIAVFSSAILIHNIKEESLLKRIFSSKPITSIGLHSYGIYLWHWPLLVVSKSIWHSNENWATITSLLLTIIISCISYKLLETPLRKRTWGFGAYVPIFTSTIILIGCTYLINKNVAGNASYEGYSNHHKNNLMNQTCHSRNSSETLQYCLPDSKGKNGKSIVLIGDSHAAHLRPALLKLDLPIKQLTDRNVPNIWLGRGCKEKAYCFDETELRTQLMKAINTNSLIVIGLSPKRLSNIFNTETRNYAMKNLFSSLEKIIVEAKTKNIKVVLVLGLPQIECPTNLSFESIFNLQGAKGVDKLCKTTKIKTDALNSSLKAIHEKLAIENSNVILFDPTQIMCSSTECSLIAENKLLYWDSLAHLTGPGLSKIEGSLNKLLIKNLTN